MYLFQILLISQIMAEKQERLLSKDELCEQKGKKVSKVEIERVIDEICALFSK